MISVNAATKNAWKNEKSYKEYEFSTGGDPSDWSSAGWSSWRGNEHIQNNSLNISSSIMSGTGPIELGGCISRKLEITHDSGYQQDHLEGQGIRIRARANETEWIPLFSGRIKQAEQDENGVLWKITAYDMLNRLSSIDITSWFNSQGTASINTIYAAFLTNNGLQDRNVTLTNGGVTVRCGSYNPVSNLTAADFLKQLCTINGCWGEIDAEGYFRTVDFDQMLVATPEEIPCQGKLHVRESYYIDGVALKGTSEDTARHYSTDPIPVYEYLIENNIFMRNLIPSEWDLLGGNLKSLLEDSISMPLVAFDVEQMAYPWLECGDVVEYSDADSTVLLTGAFMSRTMKCSQSAMDSVSTDVSESLGVVWNQHKEYVPEVNYSDTDIVADSTPLGTGNLYLVYE